MEMSLRSYWSCRQFSLKMGIQGWTVKYSSRSSHQTHL